MKLSDKRKKQIIKESKIYEMEDLYSDMSSKESLEGESEYSERDEMESVYSDMYKELNGVRPRRDLSHLSDEGLQAMIDDMQADIDMSIEDNRWEDKVFGAEAEEADKEWLAQSLHTHAGQDNEDLPVKEPVASAEEEKLESLPMRSGMGRGASMKEPRRIKRTNKPFGLKEVMISYMKKCQHLNECGCQMKSPFDAPEDEPQGYMLVQNLEKIAKKAGELTGIAKYTDDAEPWVESKINSAAEHIDAIYDYIKYGRNKKADMHGEMDHHEEHEEQY